MKYSEWGCSVFLLTSHFNKKKDKPVYVNKTYSRQRINKSSVVFA